MPKSMSLRKEQGLAPDPKSKKTMAKVSKPAKKQPKKKK